MLYLDYSSVVQLLLSYFTYHIIFIGRRLRMDFKNITLNSNYYFLWIILIANPIHVRINTSYPLCKMFNLLYGSFSGVYLLAPIAALYGTYARHYGGVLGREFLIVVFDFMQTFPIL